MTPTTAADEDAAAIRGFIQENANRVAQWLSGLSDLSDIEWFRGRFVDDLVMANHRLPQFTVDSGTFDEVMTSYHGFFRDNPVTAAVEFHRIDQLAADVFLAIHVQHLDGAAGRSSHVETTVISRSEGGRLSVYAVAE